MAAPWDRIKDLFDEAARLEPDHRKPFLDKACDGDAELRREVEALLRSSEDDSGPIRYAIADAAQMVVERTPRTVATSSLIGTTILHYRVLDRIGAGGEGIVYKAEDTRLSRFVALKFLKDAARDSESFERFQRESRAASALNHPGICTVYDIGTYRGEPFIAMEYLDGKTLKDHIATRRLSIKEILDISIEISSALAAAHNKALVHRDIKPANIFITGEGRVKVLDFGLARPVHLEDAPTVTRPGQVMGTAQYMSPQQALGEKLDRRTDIFSLGSVIHEMVAGVPAFTGANAIQIVDHILHAEPEPLGRFRSDVPPALQEIIRKCLEKDADLRYQSVTDLAVDLKRLTRNVEVKPRLGRLPIFWKAAAATLFVTTLLGIGLAYIYRSTNPDVTRFFVTPPEKTIFETGGRPAASAVISPDGRKLAFTARDSNGKLLLWIRSLDALAAVPLPESEDARFPFWSPDSRFIGYFTQTKLMKIDATGGPPQALCEAVQSRGGTWNRDGVIVFGTNGGVLQRVSSIGGKPAAISKLAPGQAGHRFPSFLPDGRHFLFQGNSRTSGEETGIYVGSLDPIDPKRLMGASSSAIYAAGNLVFVRDGILFAQPFSATTLEFSGEPVRIADRIETDVFDGVIAFSASDNGVLTYGMATPSGFANQLMWVDRSGKPGELVGAPGRSLGIDLSPDGKRVAVHRHEGQPSRSEIGSGGIGGDVWLIESPPGSNLRLTFDASKENSSPIWSPDGMNIAFASQRNGKWGIYRKRSNAAENEELLFETERQIVPQSWSADGKSILYELFDPKTASDLWLLPLDGKQKPVPILQSAYNENFGQVSPDGKWLAYVSDENTRPEVYVVGFPTGSGKRQISTAGGRFPRWRRDSREIFYMDSLSNGKMFAVELTAVGDLLQPGIPRPLFESGYVSVPHLGGDYFPYAVSGDGQRFLVPRPINAVSEAASSPFIAVVLNWTSALKAK